MLIILIIPIFFIILFIWHYFAIKLPYAKKDQYLKSYTNYQESKTKAYLCKREKDQIDNDNLLSIDDKRYLDGSNYSKVCKLEVGKKVRILADNKYTYIYNTINKRTYNYSTLVGKVGYIVLIHKGDKILQDRVVEYINVLVGRKPDMRGMCHEHFPFFYSPSQLEILED